MPLQQSTVSAFTALSENQQRAALTKMSEVAKRELLQAIKISKPETPEYTQTLVPQNSQIRKRTMADLVRDTQDTVGRKLAPLFGLDYDSMAEMEAEGMKMAIMPGMGRMGRNTPLDESVAERLRQIWGTSKTPNVENRMLRVVHYSKKPNFSPSRASIPGGSDESGAFFYPKGFESPWAGRKLNEFTVPVDQIRHVQTFNPGDIDGLADDVVEVFVPGDRLTYLRRQR